MKLPSESPDGESGLSLDSDRPEPSAERALDALGDGDCRAILRCLTDGPLTADELVRRCGIPSSTLYRKLEDLVAGGLVAEGTEISTEGRNATLYRLCVDALSIRFGDDIELETTETHEPDRPTFFEH